MKEIRNLEKMQKILNKIKEIKIFRETGIYRKRYSGISNSMVTGIIDKMKNLIIYYPPSIDKNQIIKYSFKGSDSELAKIICIKISLQHIADETSLICNTINEIAWDLFREGFFVYTHTEDNTELPKPPEGVFLFKPKKTLQILLYNYLGTFIYRKKVKFFRETPDAVSIATSTNNYEYSSQKIKLHKLFKAQMCQKLKWYQENDLFTSPYKEYKILETLIYKAKLRDRIVQELNKFFKELGLGAEIHGQNIPSIEGYEKELQELLKPK